MVTTTVEKEVLELEKTYWEAMKNRDIATAETLTADPCLVVGAEGAREISRSQFRDMMKDDDYRVRSYKLDETNATVRKLSDDVIAVAYKVHEEYERQGKAEKIDAYDTSVWVRTGNSRWQCAVHTETPATARR